MEKATSKPQNNSMQTQTNAYFITWLENLYTVNNNANNNDATLTKQNEELMEWLEDCFGKKDDWLL